MFLTPRNIGELYGEDLAKQIFPQVEKGGRNFVPTYHHDTYSFVNPSKVDLSGKRVLITGASYGIGRVMVISYAMQKLVRLPQPWQRALILATFKRSLKMQLPRLEEVRLKC